MIKASLRKRKMMTPRERKSDDTEKIGLARAATGQAKAGGWRKGWDGNTAQPEAMV